MRAVLCNLESCPPTTKNKPSAFYDSEPPYAARVIKKNRVSTIKLTNKEISFHTGNMMFTAVASLFFINYGVTSQIEHSTEYCAVTLIYVKLALYQPKVAKSYIQCTCLNCQQGKFMPEN